MGKSVVEKYYIEKKSYAKLKQEEEMNALESSRGMRLSTASGTVMSTARRSNYDQI